MRCVKWRKRRQFALRFASETVVSACFPLDRRVWRSEKYVTMPIIYLEKTFSGVSVFDSTLMQRHLLAVRC